MYVPYKLSMYKMRLALVYECGDGWYIYVCFMYSKLEAPAVNIIFILFNFSILSGSL